MKTRTVVSCENARRGQFRFLSSGIADLLAAALGRAEIRSVEGAPGLAIDAVRRRYAGMMESADADQAACPPGGGSRKT